MRRFLVVTALIFELTGFQGLAVAETPPTILDELNAWLLVTEGENIAFSPSDLRGPITRKQCNEPIRFNFTNASRRMIKADCQGQWRRFIKVPESIQLTKPSRDLMMSQSQDLEAYALIADLAKGQKVTEDLLEDVVSRRSIPTNAFREMSQLNDLYLQRDKKKGDILINEDLDTSKIVVTPMVILPSGSPLNKSTLVEVIKYTDVPADYIGSIASLRYMELSKTVGVGEIVRARHLRKARLMRRNEIVSIYSTSNNFRIETRAIALADGYLGERIEVKNPESNKIITARVVGYGLLSLD